MERFSINHPYDEAIEFDRTLTNTKKSLKMSWSRGRGSDPCRVCGSQRNSGRNFGVITCSTCKAFFRRNGRNASAIPACRFGGQCPVDERTRRQCPSCRLVKCFSVGMQKDLIRTDEERAARLELIRANRIERQRNILQEMSKRVDDEDSLSNENKLNKSLSPNDWVQITNIRSAYEHFCLIPILRADDERENFLSSQPIKCRLKESLFLHVLNVRLNSLADFFRTTIRFFNKDFSIEDRRWLMRNNLRHLLLFSSMDLMKINGKTLHFDSNKSTHTVYLYVYGADLLERASCLVQRLNRSIDDDPAISKLTQIVLFLSPCLLTNFLPDISRYQPSLETIRQFFFSQQHYIDLLWLYLIYRYGHNRAIKSFVSIIGNVLQQQLFAFQLDQTLIDRQPFSNSVYHLLTQFSSE